MRPRFVDEEGAVAIIVAFVLLALFAFGALTVDVAYWYDTRHQLQASADAAALAGCTELIQTEDVGKAHDEASKYALLNANGAGSNLSVDSINVDASGGSVYVRVSRAVPSWLSQVAGYHGRTVHADAKAIKTPVTGARYVMPWGIPIIEDSDVDRIEAMFVDSHGSTVSGPQVLSHIGSRVWQGSVSAPSIGTSASAGYDLRVAAYNVFGIPEWVGDSHGPQAASRVVVDSGDANYPFSAVSVTNDYPTSDGTIAIDVNVTTKVAQTGVTLLVDGNKLPMTGSGTNWSRTIQGSNVKFDDGFLDTFPVDIYLGNKADGVVDAYVHVRRSTYPFASASSNPGIAASNGSVQVEVHLSTFSPTDVTSGQIYTLRVGSAGVETGNFGELNFSKLQHNTGYNLAPCPPDPPGVPLGTNVRDWVATGYGGGIHIGDIVEMSPGNSGWTEKVVNDRLAKYGDVVIVPVVTKFQDKGGGSYAVIVRTFAAMRVVKVIDKGTIEAEFIKFVATPDEYGSGGGGGAGTIYAARLVSP